MEIKKLETRYYKANANDCTHIKAEVYYSIGGLNYFTYKQEQRGYYISISPVNTVCAGPVIKTLSCSRPLHSI